MYVCLACFGLLAFICLKCWEREASEMAQWLRTEESHTAACDCLQLQFQEIHGDLNLFQVRL